MAKTFNNLAARLKIGDPQAGGSLKKMTKRLGRRVTGRATGKTIKTAPCALGIKI